MFTPFLRRGPAASLTTAVAILAFTALSTHDARADAVTDWNGRLGQLIADARLGTPPAVRVSALVQTAVHHALGDPTDAAPNDATAAAAVAAANRTMLLRLLPAPAHAAVEAAYATALAAIPEGAAKNAGIQRGTQAANALLERRGNDGAGTPESYRPITTPGTYVPTVTPAVTQWPRRTPWLMATAAQFRPAAPPALASEAWARDFNETKTLGSRVSTTRSAEQTEIARFWDYSLPAVYFGLVRSVAAQPGRDLVRNARLYAAAAQAMDDALISVFDAKYTYNFWRPGTAIRNADTDGHDGTERDATWAPLIDVPMHPEYPSGHSILATSVATVLKADMGTSTLPALNTSSPTAAPGRLTTRRFADLDTFVREVSNARIWGGLHFRSATDAGEAMGRRIGELAVRKVLMDQADH